MARYLRLEDIKQKPRVPIAHLPKQNRYYCERCDKYHLIYSNIGNEHRDLTFDTGRVGKERTA